MSSCPKCAHRPIRRKLGIRACLRCGVIDAKPKEPTA